MMNTLPHLHHLRILQWNATIVLGTMDSLHREFAQGSKLWEQCSEALHLQWPADDDFGDSRSKLVEDPSRSHRTVETKAKTPTSKMQKVTTNVAICDTAGDTNGLGKGCVVDCLSETFAYPRDTFCVITGVQKGKECIDKQLEWEVGDGGCWRGGFWRGGR